MSLGLSGALTKATIRSPLTPLFLLAAFALGLVALATIPREEEPQISVPLIDIFVRADGLKAPDAVELVTKPLETIVKGVDGVEHVYSQTKDDQVLVTARFIVGSDPDDAITRIEEKIRADLDRIPVGIPTPHVVARGISDVPIMVVTLTPTPEAIGRWNDQALHTLVERVQGEVAKVKDVGLTFIVGGRPQELRIEPDPAKLALYRAPLSAIIEAVRAANRAFSAGDIRGGGKTEQALIGQTLKDPAEIGLLTVPSADGGSVYLKDVAKISLAPREDQARVWRIEKDGVAAPAVSLAIAKRNGANAVVVSKAIEEKLKALEGGLVPHAVEVSITRNYGETANEKANELLFHLGLATASIVALIFFAIGRREAAVTLIVIPTTILLTLFASNLMGFTINRVSLFALIFSIGILVDDAIVIVENIARHWAMNDGRTRVSAAIDAVAEVGNPTIVATLTVIAALLPMMFVSGLMGPYMAPIPANASAAMLFSFLVAVIIAPWLMMRLAGKAGTGPLPGEHEHAHGEGIFGRFYRKVATPIIRTRKAARRFLFAVGLATLAACALFATKTVRVKLLPFDNKSELDVVVDLPEGASLETTERVLFDAARVARSLPEVQIIDAYAGTASPFNFNGLVRHYYLRRSPELGDLALTLSPKDKRARASHAVARDLRQRLKSVAVPPGTSIKIVETPPGPPVISTLLAEIYGPDAATRRAVAEKMREIFSSIPYIVDVDDSFGAPRPGLRIVPDRAQLEYFGLAERDVMDSIAVTFGGEVVGYSHRGEGRDPIEISIRLPESARVWNEALKAMPVGRSAAGRLVELGEVAAAHPENAAYPIFRRDARYAEMALGELAGAYEAPIYGMFDVDAAIKKADWGTLPRPQVRFYGQPADESAPTVLWDGEWEITYVTFRDMGAAFAVALLGIYILVVGQFKSFRLPLIILTPVPLTLVGIVLGHILFNAPFTATSMIGFIALAGIIVRNSILLVDFIRHTAREGRPLRDALLEAGAVRFKPIALTALAAMIGAAVILFDPIFQGLAISLLFGLASSTALTVLVIPAIYVVMRDDGLPATGDEASAKIAAPDAMTAAAR